MAELNEAYATLSDPWERSRYDLSLTTTAGLSPRTADSRVRSSVPAGAWVVAVPVVDAADTPRHGDAGPPPAYPLPSGTVFSYGRYRGWSISQIAHHDRAYLEWLERTPSGRAYREELTAGLAR
jgi:curved DNA-binding protein CbpA